jgi:hypothetical protein
MKIFLSWSGDSSRQIAAALNEWLPLIFSDVSCWLSTRNIEAGKRWGNELDAELASTTFGILCLTPNNLLAPWLLFEAGALSRSVEVARVVPYCVGVAPDEIQGPLSRFQSVRADAEGTRALLRSINSVLANPRTEQMLDRIFDRWWPDLERGLAGIPASTDARGPSVVKVRRILCASTAQFEKLGASEDMDVIDANYPSTVTRLQNVSLDALRETLAFSQFEIVHLLGYVEPKTGDFVFSENERLPAVGLLKLIERAGTHLVFLATCDSLTLGAILSRTVSVIAASDWVESDPMISWERCFYQFLAKGTTLLASYDLAQATLDLPMRLLIRNDALFIPVTGASSS